VVWKLKIPIVSYNKDATLTIVAAVLAASVTSGSRSGSGFNKLASVVWLKRPIVSDGKEDILTVVAAVVAASVSTGSRSGSVFNKLASVV
jgi:outer membrane murein-binding lipoprotein Lpp